MKTWMRSSVGLFAFLSSANAGCGPELVPATQIVLSVDSDLSPGTQLTEVQIEVFDDRGNEQSRGVPIARDPGDAETSPKKQLPFDLTVLPGDAPQVTIQVTGYGMFGLGPTRRLVTQRALVHFAAEKTQFVRVYLGQICVDVTCDGEPDRVCYPTDYADVLAGMCGSVATRSEHDVSIVDPDQIEAEVGKRDETSGVGDDDTRDGGTVRSDAGVVGDADVPDAAPHDAGPANDAEAGTPRPDGSIPAYPDGGRDGGSADAGSDAGRADAGSDAGGDLTIGRGDVSLCPPPLSCAATRTSVTR